MHCSANVISTPACSALWHILLLPDVIQGKNGFSVYQHLPQKIQTPKLGRKQELPMKHTERAGAWLPEEPDIRGNTIDAQEYKPGSRHRLGCCLCKEPTSPIP